MKPIFEYTDYREWIRDAFEDFKKRKAVISWRYMAMKLGADPGNLLRISQGKIHLAVNFIKPMAEFFELDEKETSYWTELVYFGRAKSDQEALNHYEKMQALKGIPLKRLAKKELGTTTLSVPSSVFVILKMIMRVLPNAVRRQSRWSRLRML